jgi:hypothetical protein
MEPLNNSTGMISVLRGSTADFTVQKAVLRGSLKANNRKQPAKWRDFSVDPYWTSANRI